MTTSDLRCLVNRNARKLARVISPIVLGTMLLLLTFLFIPRVAAVPPAGPLLQLGEPAIHPPGNTHTAAVTTTVSITYDEAIDGGTVSTRTFAVHAMQTGLLTQTYGVNGGTIRLTPPWPFKAGELVQVSATTGTLSSSGQGPVSPTVWQFRTATRTGGGVFTAGSDWGGNNETRDLALGDLDSVGDLDVFVANNGNNEVWRNAGGAQGGTPGTFLKNEPDLDSANSYAVALGDLDGDGDLDAFVANNGANEVWWNAGGAQGGTPGTFIDSGQSLGSGDSKAVALGDLDGDGDLDAFIGNDGHDEVRFNDGTGRFDHIGQTIHNSWGADVALGDLDGDGDLDAFVSAYGGIDSAVWVNSGDGLFTIGWTLPISDSHAVALGDLDSDGDLDAFVGCSGGPNSSNRVWLNNGDGALTGSSQDWADSSTEDVALGDVDGDGDLDAFVGNSGDESNMILLNDGTGVLATTQSLSSANSRVVVLGDIDGDGDLDALDGNLGQPNEVWLNEDPQVQINQIIPRESYFAEIVEFNGSGTTDTITEMLDEYEWTLISITKTCGTQSDSLVFGDSARLLINSLPVGKHWVCLRGRNANSVWSDYATMTTTVHPDRWMHSDIAVSREGISFWKDANATIPESNPDQEDVVYVKVRVDNISLQDTPDTVVVSVHDGGESVATDTISFIAANTAQSVVLPWTVGSGSDVYEDGYKVVSVSIQYTHNATYFKENPLPPWDEPHIESTYDNNQATAFIVVGPPITGTYAISVTADIVPLISPFTGRSRLYAGYQANLFGDAHYNWGSRIPVMGAETSVEITGAGGYSRVYNTWTTAPAGGYVSTVQLPPEAGTYTATINVHDCNLIGNTVLTFTVADPPEPLPDLYVQRFSVGLSGRGVYERDWHTYVYSRVYEHSGLFGILNKPIVIGARVVNGGNEHAGRFQVSFYNGSPHGSGTLLGSVSVSGLNAKAGTPVTFDWTPTQTGVYTIQVVVDENNEIRESNEINNYDAYYYRYQSYYNKLVHRDIIDIRAKGPDLRAVDLLYVEPDAGQKVTMTAAVKNIGHYKVRYREGFTVTITDGYPGISNSTVLKEAWVDGPLWPNRYRTIGDIVWDTGLSGFVPGQHHICVVVDTGDEVDEELEENNVNCWDAYVYPEGYDLWPVDLRFSPKAPLPGTVVSMTATIKNRGADTFTRTEVVTFYLGPPSEGDVIGTSELEEPIDGRGGTDKVFAAWTTTTTHGTAYIYVEVAGHGYVRGLTIRPDPPPDLSVRSEDIRVKPRSPERNQTVSVEVDIANLGVTTATNFIVRFHTDSPIEGLIQLGSPRVVESLAPGMTTTVQANATLAAAERYYAVKVEAIPPIGQWDADFGDNEATTSFGVPLLPGLAMFKETSWQRLLPNYVYLDYVLAVVNNWEDTVSGTFTVTDSLPPDMHFENPAEGRIGYYDDYIPSMWDCSRQDLTVTCVYAGSLAPNASTEVHIWGQSWVGTAPTNTIINCATVYTPDEDVLEDNTACYTIAMGEIAGTVTDSNGRSLAGIDVTAYRSVDGEWDYAGQTTTDASGHYALTHLEVGTYAVEFWDSSNSYRLEFYDGASDFKDADPVDVIMGTTTLVNASLDTVMTGTITDSMVISGGTRLKMTSVPSGRVTDAETGAPISGVTVTLYKVPGWWPQESPLDDRPNTCQCHNSKLPDDPWSQTAPTMLGIKATPTLTEFAPLVNPQVTNELGYYSWDLDEGCWYVVAEADGYEPKVSPLIGIPPEVTDLDLALILCRDYLPVVLK